MFFSRFLIGAVGMLLTLTDLSAQAQNYPVKPIKLIIPATTGTSDVVARALAPRLSNALGQSVVVEQMPGAGTNIGNNFVSHLF